MRKAPTVGHVSDRYWTTPEGRIRDPVVCDIDGRGNSLIPHGDHRKVRPRPIDPAKKSPCAGRRRTASSLNARKTQWSDDQIQRPSRPEPYCSRSVDHRIDMIMAHGFEARSRLAGNNCGVPHQQIERHEMPPRTGRHPTQFGNRHLPQWLVLSVSDPRFGDGLQVTINRVADAAPALCEGHLLEANSDARQLRPGDVDRRAGSI